MRRFNAIWTALTALLLMAACSADDTGLAQHSEVQLLLQGTILGDSGTATRTVGAAAIQNTLLEAGNTVGAFIYRKGGTTKETTGEQYGYSNYPLSAVSGSQLLYSANQPMFPESGERKVDIYAYAPYDASYTDVTTDQTSFVIQADQRTRDSFIASDLLWGKALNVALSSAISYQEVPLQFAHKLSQICIEINAGDGVTVADLHGATVTLNGVNTTGTIRLSDGTITTGTTTGDVAVLKCGFDEDETEIASTDANYADYFKGSAIVYPIDPLPANVMLTITTASNTSYTAQLITTNIGTWVGGKKYTYQVRVSADGISFSTVISPWDASEPDRSVTPNIQ